ncbi:hypothetical protein ACKLTP_15425 [Paenarthrobacter ureafaciens]|uniref:hypothetical protein n=1 Tax=Paenarthrobacter TaxID=1742992 RepID=UPI00222E0ACA|nr:hypothetical protein [Paenarthrobacter sp. PAE-2]MCW3768798.1 hypothetical protein [Paenarthrobacter sp. PAE-2]
MQHSKISLAVVPILSFAVVLAAGYLALQSEGMLNGYLFDFTGTPAVSIAKRLPWELHVATVLVCFSATVGYRRLAVSVRLKALVLVTLVLASVLSILFYEPIHMTRTNLFAMAFVDGGVSAMTLGLIAAVAADSIHSRRGRARNSP